MPAVDPEAFIAQLQEKMQNLLTDFSEGKLNKDQFNTVYERYNTQLRLVEDAMQSGLTDPVAAARDTQQTAAIMQQRGGKFLGLRIFNNRNSMMIHTLGEFDVATNVVMPYVDNLIMAIESRQPLGRLLEKLDDNRWILFGSGSHTISASLFRNEPSKKQAQDINRLHRDFEAANRTLFGGGNFDPSRLVFPFMVLMSKKSGKSG
jgi:hypothetical protein